jgi:predicted tellurium resistance membrane protein TerC
MQKETAFIEEEELKSTTQFALYVGGAFALGGAIFAWKGPVAAEEYFAGYLLEQSLSIDNLFVFVLCFSFFKTPLEYQDKVLGWGIYSAAVLRLIMILAGVELVENFKPLLLVFAAVLVYSSFSILFGTEEEEEEDLSENIIVQTVNKVRSISNPRGQLSFFSVPSSYIAGSFWSALIASPWFEMES